MKYGSNIGRKFFENGEARAFHGNTVVADVPASSEAYGVMTDLRDMVIEAGFDSHLILLPADSYHMTVIRGVNDQVRKEGYWPPNLPFDMPMELVDDYMEAAIRSVEMPKAVMMKFDRVKLSEGDVEVLLVPADEKQNQKLRTYRDRVAESVGFYLPKHKDYRFHITLAYVRVIAEGEDETKMTALVEKMNAHIANRPAFEITNPYVAFYKDMLGFSPVRIQRP